MKSGDGDVTLWINLVGVSYDNQSGHPRSRKKIIEKYCRDGQVLTLGWEEDNPHDPDAVSVLVTVRSLLGFSRMLRVGYIPRNAKEPILEHMRRGGQTLTRIYRISCWGDQPYVDVNVDVVLIGHKRLDFAVRDGRFEREDEMCDDGDAESEFHFSPIVIAATDGKDITSRQKPPGLASRFFRSMFQAVPAATTFLARTVADGVRTLWQWLIASGRRLSNVLGEQRVRALRTWGPAIVLPTWSLFAILRRPGDMVGVLIISSVIAAGIWGTLRALAIPKK